MAGVRRELLFITRYEKAEGGDKKVAEQYKLWARPTDMAGPGGPEMDGPEIQNVATASYSVRYSPRLDPVLEDPTAYQVRTNYNAKWRKDRTLTTFDLREDRRRIDVVFS